MSRADGERKKNFACCGISPKGLLPEHSLPKAEILTDRACGAAFLIKALRRRVKKKKLCLLRSRESSTPFLGGNRSGRPKEQILCEA